VHRFTKAWRAERARAPSHAFVPLSFAAGEAYQFDWSHEGITLQGLPLVIKAAHMKLTTQPSTDRPGAMDKWPACARLSAVAPAGHLPTAPKPPRTSDLNNQPQAPRGRDCKRNGGRASKRFDKQADRTVMELSLRLGDVIPRYSQGRNRIDTFAFGAQRFPASGKDPQVRRTM
jgi:hypothetical protein